MKLKDIKIKFNFKVVDWLAYPEYTLGDDLNSFVLTPGLYYTSRLAILELLRENVHYIQPMNFQDRVGCFSYGDVSPSSQ